MSNPKTEMQRLLATVKKLTAKRGSRASLAKEIGVSRQRINEWLFGHRVPGGLYALRLHQWTEMQLEKNKRASGAINTADARSKRRTK